jgi:acyl-CoA synthetase (AMP-forming)/AMP-acid ligase II
MDLNQQTLQARSARHARQQPDHVAIICEGREVTYAELHRGSNQTAHALLAEGLTRGARVAYLGQESEYYYDLTLACAKAGVVLVPINWRLTSGEVDHVLRDSGAELLFIETPFRGVAERLRAALPSLVKIIEMDTPQSRADGYLRWRAAHPDNGLDPGTGTEDPVVQMYTSGTTGLPKGVVLAHRTFFAYIDSIAGAEADLIDWHPKDRSLVGFPGLHSGGMGWFLAGFTVGLTNVVMRMFLAEEAARLIERHRITITFMAPAMLQMMLAERWVSKETFRSLRKVTYGGSPISPKLLQRCIEGLGCGLAQMYASAESGSVVTCLGPSEHFLGNPKLTSAGRPCPGNQVKIVGDAGESLPPGQIGTICVDTPTLFVEYWRRQKATSECLADGWLRMPDAGYLDEDGYLHVCDRIDDTIIVAGQNIYPAEVEKVLTEHPAVADAAVIGIPDERWGQAVKAIVVLHSGQQATARDLMLSLRGRIADFKIPVAYDFADSLPRNPTGKVLRRALREQQAGTLQSLRVSAFA